ncbi:MAG: cyclodeaminase/cyclohydrolase family protein [Vulcanimicrobiaceae bacterium]
MRLGSESPTPGGGSAAMFVAATGAALLAMVCRITGANPKFAAKHDLTGRLIRLSDALRQEFLDARARDEAAFEAVVRAQRLPKSTESERAIRARTLEAALQHAAEIPLHLAARVLAGLEAVRDALAIENANLVSDLGCAAEFLHAALAGCAYNVRINHKYMKDQAVITAQRNELNRIESAAQAPFAAVVQTLRAGLL